MGHGTHLLSVTLGLLGEHASMLHAWWGGAMPHGRGPGWAWSGDVVVGCNDTA